MGPRGFPCSLAPGWPTWCSREERQQGPGGARWPAPASPGSLDVVLESAVVVTRPFGVYCCGSICRTTLCGGDVI